MPLMNRPPLSERRLREKQSSRWRRHQRRTVAGVSGHGRVHDLREEPSFRQEHSEPVLQHDVDLTSREGVRVGVSLSNSADVQLVEANAYFSGFLDSVGQLTLHPLAQLPLGGWTPLQSVAPTTLSPSKVVRVQGFQLPEAIGHLATEIERSRSLLELADDWDEAGSPGYEEETWRRAVDLMVRIATHTWKEHRVRVESVDIVPGANGSIGLEWRVPGHELLINVPADPAQEALYYGDDGDGGGKQKGTFRTEKPNRWLSMWMAE